MLELLKEYIHVCWLSMLPVCELRGALIYAAANPALNRWIALPIAIVANSLPVPFLLIYGQKLLHWFAGADKNIVPFFDRRSAAAQAKLDGGSSSALLKMRISLCSLCSRFFGWFGRVCTKINARAIEKSKSPTFEKYSTFGLFLFVAVPAPGTGAWMGSLIAAILHMDKKKAVPAIIAGVIAAGLIMTLGTGAVIGVADAINSVA